MRPPLTPRFRSCAGVAFVRRGFLNSASHPLVSGSQVGVSYIGAGRGQNCPRQTGLQAIGPDHRRRQGRLGKPHAVVGHPSRGLGGGGKTQLPPSLTANWRWRRSRDLPPAPSCFCLWHWRGRLGGWPRPFRQAHRHNRDLTKRRPALRTAPSCSFAFADWTSRKLRRRRAPHPGPDRGSKCREDGRLPKLVAQLPSPSPRSRICQSTGFPFPLSVLALFFSSLPAPLAQRCRTRLPKRRRLRRKNRNPPRLMPPPLP